LKKSENRLKQGLKKKQFHSYTLNIIKNKTLIQPQFQVTRKRKKYYSTKCSDSKDTQND